MQHKSYSMITLLRNIYISITLFLLTIVFVFSLYSLHTVKSQFTASQQQALNLYMSELDQCLSRISSSLHMYRLQEGAPDFTALTSGDLYRRKSDIISDFSSNILFLSYCEGLFLFDTANDEYGYAFSNSPNSPQTYNTRMKIKDAAASIMEASHLTASSGWHLTKLDGQQYLLFLQWTDDFCYGSWASTDTLLPAVSRLSPYPDTLLFLTDEQGDCLSSSSDRDPSEVLAKSTYITTSTASSTVPLTLSISTPEPHYLATMSVSLRVLIGISIFALLTIAIASTALKRIIKEPLNQVLTVITQYESGNLDYVPRNEGMPREILHINQALSSMSHEIRMLKIDVYEKQLHLKDIQLQYLQHQIKPHFIINILNTIGLMVQMKENKKITEVISCLSQYMRNTMNLTIRTATLRHELDHLNNYLTLQQIRYPDQITFHCSIDPQLQDFQIPILTVQTLVENIFKHALEPYEPLVIEIHAFIEQDRMILSVRDNGCGFPAELIEDFNHHPSTPGDGQHIGLVNIRQRLELEWPDSSMLLSNDSGAVVTITFPCPQPSAEAADCTKSPDADTDRLHRSAAP